MDMFARLITFVVVVFAVTACSKDSDPPPGVTKSFEQGVLSKGVFLDSAVEGLSFRFDDFGDIPATRGLTNDQGEFDFIVGRPITFSIGDLDLPTTIAKPIITPLDLFNTQDPNDPRVVNLLRLLQTLDTDAVPDNGISLNTPPQFNPENQSILLDFGSADFDDTVNNLPTDVLSISRPMVDSALAVQHFLKTLDQIEVTEMFKEDVRNTVLDQEIISNSALAKQITVTTETDNHESISLTIVSLNQTLFPSSNISLSQSGATRDLVIIPAAGQTGSGEFVITLSNNLSTITKTFTLTVVPQQVSDNCPNIPDSNQSDLDGDGVGDQCENAVWDQFVWNGANWQ